MLDDPSPCCPPTGLGHPPKRASTLVPCRRLFRARRGLSLGGLEAIGSANMVDMADDVNDLFIFVRLTSQQDAIHVAWDEVGGNWSAGHSLIRDFARHRQHIGPEPRIKLPSGHPHHGEYVYDSLSGFRYVHLAVRPENDVVTLHEQFGKDLMRESGEPGPLRPWKEFMSVLLDEVQLRFQ